MCEQYCFLAMQLFILPCQIDFDPFSSLCTFFFILRSRLSITMYDLIFLFLCKN
uniref:Uncharacterized protein n=1 Tax=Rhizophora mucronata TaxID=61149 RepID=A0A2P2J3Z8_RHIMU